MEKIVSRDGTPIAYQRSGIGVPLVLVHGTSGTFQTWAQILPLLERKFTVYAIDRRGRGESGDSAGPYAMEREAEDVAAVVDAIGERVNLFGHSYGAVCALEASLLTTRTDRLVLYEPPIPTRDFRGADHTLMERMELFLANGNNEAVLTMFMAELVGTSLADIELSKSMAAWPARKAAAHTIPREIIALGRYSFEPGRFREASTPTLLLLGGESPVFFGTAIRLLESALRNSKTEILAGQHHLAMNTAPELLAEALSAFILSP